MDPERPDPVPPASDPAAADPPGAPDEASAELVARRQFFRAFSRDAARTAVQVAGMAVAFQRGTGAAAGQLLGLAVSPEETLGRLAGAASDEGAAEPRATFRSPYRIESDEVVVLDQRAYPEAIVEIRCATAAQVAGTMVERRIVGAPVLAQVAAYGVWRGAVAARGLTTFIRLAVLHNAGETLRHARLHVAPVTHAVRRVVHAWEAELERTDDDALAAGAARREADAIAAEMARALTAVVAAGVATLEQPVDRPLEVMTLDSTGALAGGVMGGALGVVLAIAAAGRSVHVWLLETDPGATGARLAAWELSAAGVATTVVADASAAWLLAHATIDVVLVGADRVAADGAVTAVIGTLAVAELAQRHEVPFLVVTPLIAVDPDVADAAASAVESERYADIGVEVVPAELRAAGVEARGPLQDVTPPDLIGGLVTEAGVLRAPYGPALAAATAAEGG